MTTTNPFLGHELRSPRLGVADAAALAREHWGVEGRATELGSHQEQNFLIDAGAERFVLKIANAGFSSAELDLQNRAMECAAVALDGLVPVPVRTPDGRDIVEATSARTPVRLRLVTYLGGRPLRELGYLAPGVLGAVGSLAGRVAAALASFDHPAAERVLQWDVRLAADVVAAYAPHVAAPERRALAERTVERAATTLATLDASLRRQVIHRDVTDWNVLARKDGAGRPSPSGLIDFGDTGRSWLAAECAVAASALTERSAGRTIQDAADVVRGFHAVLPLTEEEVAALPALIAARAALCAVSCDRQAALDPDNPYVAASLESGWTRLAAIAAVGLEVAHAAFRAACGLPPVRARPVPRGTAPLVVGYGTPLDLSTESDLLRFGAWQDAERIADAVGESHALGRYGEARIVHDAGPKTEEPATVHLGIDVFAPAGTPVAAPVPGLVVDRTAREVRLALTDGPMLRVAGIEPAPARGDELVAGDELGRIAGPEPGARLPAHVHVQLAEPGLEDIPGLVPASLADAWLAVCPDPGPLLDVAAAVSRRGATEALTRRRRFVAAAHPLYYPDDPPRIERGWRQWLYDTDGRAYLDVVNNVAIVGHSHPRVEGAAARGLRVLNTNSRFLYDAMGRFAERLAGLVPDPLGVVFLVNTGSEANDLALRIARQVTGNRDILCLERSYHGWTAATDELLHPSPGGTANPVPRPNPYTGPYRDREPHTAPLYAAYVDGVLARLAADGRAPAAFICEPYLGNSGGIPLPSGYLRLVYDAVRRAGGVCIADEVQVGYGRLGRHFWAFEEQGVVPDVVTIAKATGNGHPVAAVITSAEIAEAFARRTDLFSSTGGSPVSCEAALAVLDVIEEERLQENARRVGEYVDARLAPLADRHEIVSAIHGMGLYRGVELVRDAETREPARAEALALCDRMRTLGVIVQPTGPGGNVLKLKPPLCVAESDVDYFAEALETVLETGW